MRVTINGKERTVPEDATVGWWVRSCNYRVEMIAVELDGSIVPKDAFDTTALHEDAVMEVVGFVGGG